MAQAMLGKLFTRAHSLRGLDARQQRNSLPHYSKWRSYHPACAASQGIAFRMKLLAGGRIGRRLHGLLRTQAFILDQAAAHIEKADRFIFERRAAGIIPKIDVSALVDCVERSQAPRDV